MADGAGVARRKPYEVGYMEVTETNLAEVAEFCGGELDEAGGCVLVPTMHGQVPAGPGMFVMHGKVDCYPIDKDVYAQGYDTVREPS